MSQTSTSARFHRRHPPIRTGFGPIFPAALWRSKVLAPIDNIAAKAVRSIIVGDDVTTEMARVSATGHPRFSQSITLNEATFWRWVVSFALSNAKKGLQKFPATTRVGEQEANRVRIGNGFNRIR